MSRKGPQRVMFSDRFGKTLLSSCRLSIRSERGDRREVFLIWESPFIEPGATSLGSVKMILPLFWREASALSLRTEGIQVKEGLRRRSVRLRTKL